MKTKWVTAILATVIVLLIGLSVSLQLDQQSLQEQVTSLREALASQQEEVTSLEDELNSSQEKVASLEEQLKGTLPYSKARGSSITLHNNFNSVSNPTWAELQAFLEGDDTEGHRYNVFSFVCGDFAEMLHNRAEAVGIRAGIAIIHFADTDELHAVNVFYTTDYGLVYIDDTGEDMTLYCTYSLFMGTTVCNMREGEDTVAYVVEGKEYGLVPLVSFWGSHYPTGYHVYEQYAQDWESYTKSVEGYNAEVDAYTIALGGRYFLEEPEYSEFMHWYDRLEGERLMLMELSEQLGDYWYESLGIVSDIEVYW